MVPPERRRSAEGHADHVRCRDLRGPRPREEARLEEQQDLAAAREGRRRWRGGLDNKLTPRQTYADHSQNAKIIKSDTKSDQYQDTNSCFGSLRKCPRISIDARNFSKASGKCFKSTPTPIRLLHTLAGSLPQARQQLLRKRTSMGSTASRDVRRRHDCARGGELRGQAVERREPAQGASSGAPRTLDPVERNPFSGTLHHSSGKIVT